MKLIKKIWHWLFTPRIDYKKLFLTPWNKEKSDYLFKKIKGKTTIGWEEKRGKGGYFDKQLLRFIETVDHTGYDDEIYDEILNKK